MHPLFFIFGRCLDNQLPLIFFTIGFHDDLKKYNAKMSCKSYISHVINHDVNPHN